MNLSGRSSGQIGRGDRAYSHAHHSQATQVICTKLVDLSPCLDIFGPAEEATTVVENSLPDFLRQEADPREQIAKSRSKERDHAALLGLLSQGESSVSKLFSSQPPAGLQDAAPG